MREPFISRSRQVMRVFDVAGLSQILLLLSGDVELNPGPITGPLQLKDSSNIETELEGVASKWNEIGLELGLSASWLEELKQQGKDPVTCLHDVISEWLSRVDLFPMWYSVTRALEKVGEKELAKQLHDKFCIEDGPLTDEEKRNKSRIEKPRPQGCGFENCRCATAIEASLKLPTTDVPFFDPESFEGDGVAHKEKLLLEHKEMVYAYQHLLSSTWRSLTRKSITATKLVDYLKALDGTNPDKLAAKPLLTQILEELQEDTTVEEVFVDCHEYYSYFTHILIKDILLNLGGTIEDKRLFNHFRDKFSYFGKRKVVETPPVFMAPSKHGHTCITVKVNRDPRRSTINDLDLFRVRLCEMLHLSKYALRLISVEAEDETMIQMYQFPSCLRSDLFPLTQRQKTQLRSDRILNLKCCDYEFDVEELGPDPVEEVMRQLAEEERQRAEAEAARLAAARAAGLEPEPVEEVKEEEPPPPPPIIPDEELMEKALSSLMDTDYQISIKPEEVTKAQLRLARPGLEGKNYVAVLPKASDKLVIYGLILSKHIAQKTAEKEQAKVVIVARTKSRAEELHKELKALLPKAEMELFEGTEENSMSTKLCLSKSTLIVCSAGKLHYELDSEAVHFSNITLLLMDDCHLAMTENSHEDVLQYFIRSKIYNKIEGPHMVGVTCSPGEEYVALTIEEMRERLLDVCGMVNASGGMSTPANYPLGESPPEKGPSIRTKSFKSRDAKIDFVTHLSVEMGLLEDKCGFSCPFEKFSSDYSNFVQARRDTLLAVSTADTIASFLPALSYLELLLCYAKALSTCKEYGCEDAIQVLRRHQIREASSRSSDSPFKEAELALVKLQAELQEIMTRKNPVFEAVSEDLSFQFSQSPFAKGILFVDSLKEAQFLCEEIARTQFHARPSIIDYIYVTKNSPVSNMEVDGDTSPPAQEQDILRIFTRGECRLLIVPFPIEKDKNQLVLPSCNFLIRLRQIPDLTTMVETEYMLTSVASSASKPCSGLLEDLQLSFMDSVLKEPPFEEQTEQMLTRRQENLMHDYVARKHIPLYPRRKRKSKTPAVEMLTLKCKTCKTFACKGSDIYTLFVDGGQFYVVPNRDFRFRYTTKVYRSKHKAIKRISRRYRMLCNNCDSRWGTICYFPARGCELPVVKSKYFLFEMQQKFYRVKMWADALFYVPPLTACTFFRARGSSPPTESE